MLRRVFYRSLRGGEGNGIRTPKPQVQASGSARGSGAGLDEGVVSDPSQRNPRWIDDAGSSQMHSAIRWIRHPARVPGPPSLCCRSRGSRTPLPDRKGPHERNTLVCNTLSSSRKPLGHLSVFSRCDLHSVPAPPAEASETFTITSEWRTKGNPRRGRNVFSTRT